MPVKRSTTNPIQVEAFEQIRASSRMALLRLIFRVGRRSRAQTKIAGLVVNNHTSTHRVAPLPALPAPGGAERVAFAVPYELLQGDRTFAVELESGTVVDLPHPVASGSTPIVPSATPVTSATRDPDPLTPLPGGPEQHQPRTVATVTLDPDAEPRQIEELAEERLMAETEARTAAEADAQALRSRVEQLLAEAEERNRENEIQRAELEQRLADALAELEAVTTTERRAVREARQLKEKLARQAAELAELKASPS
jgi:hypothetical protein